MQTCFASAAVMTTRDRAWERYHLTAKEAGIIAREAKVRRFEALHFSPKYMKISELTHCSDECLLSGLSDSISISDNSFNAISWDERSDPWT